MKRVYFFTRIRVILEGILNHNSFRLASFSKTRNIEKEKNKIIANQRLYNYKDYLLAPLKSGTGDGNCGKI
jgi:hypothetical protein